ncbi:RNA polymerase sigma factor [Marinilabilia rubra]|uniref:RNA polymerase sigma factor n=1 Tax=Marinilabilia rubra TaxID=2162893 RepID=A0A2U2B8Y6_9BACT|nr:RNA polymerase sigma factor [Marinilabilia rubra]PWD99512.1 RNA polymerase sigma factor [Marinilabilia rubra]
MQKVPTDNQLVIQAKKGHTEAFSTLVDRYRQKVFQSAMGFLHNPDDAEDLTQEIFVKAWNALDGFDQRSAFSTWLYRIAVNKAINVIRKNKIRSFIGLNEAGNEPFSTESNAEEAITVKEQKEEIKKAVDQLNNKQKKAFVLFYYQDLNMKEVAEVLGISQKAVESLVFRARKKLQSIVDRK